MYTTEASERIISHLTKLLADEYILMNKSVGFLLSLTSSPAEALPETVYDQLKENVRDITDFLKSIDHYTEISINAFLENSRLHNHNQRMDTHSTLEDILTDHEFLISVLNNATADATNEDGDFENLALRIKCRHIHIKEQLVCFINDPQNKWDKAA